MKKETWDHKKMNVIGYFHTKYIGMYYYIMDKTEEEIKNALKLVIEKYQDYKKKKLDKNDIPQCNSFLIVETKLCRSLGIPEPLVYVILFFMTINKAIDEEEALINKERFLKEEFQNLLVYMYHIETLTETFHSKTGYDYLVSSIDQAKGGKKKNENYKEIKDFLKKETKLFLKKTRK